MRPQNLTKQKLSAMVPPPPDDRFDQELMGWFARHGGPWSGTASELLAALKTRAGVGNDSWPQSPRALYSHIESHTQILRSLGLDALLYQGCPRMLSLRSCQDEEPAGKPSSGISGFNRSCDPPIELAVLADDQKRESADSDQVNPTRDETLTQDIRSAESDGITNRLVRVSMPTEITSKGVFSKAPGKHFLPFAEMRMQIREQGLDLKSAIDLVVKGTQEITRSCGVALGLLRAPNAFLLWGVTS